MFIILEREAESQQQFIVRRGAVVIEDFRLRLDAVGTSRERLEISPSPRHSISVPLPWLSRSKNGRRTPGAPVDLCAINQCARTRSRRLNRSVRDPATPSC